MRCGKWWGRGRLPAPRALHCFYGVDGNGVPVRFAGDGDFLAGYVRHLVLIGDGVDFALFRHEHGGRSALNAALRAGLVAPHFLLAGAILIDDVAAEIGRHRGNACQRAQNEQFFQLDTLLQMVAETRNDYTPLYGVPATADVTDFLAEFKLVNRTNRRDISATALPRA